MEIFIIVLIVVIVLIGYLVFFNKKDLKDLTTIEFARTLKYSQTTPKGLKIYGGNLSPEVQEALDLGASKFFEIAGTCRQYTNKLEHADWSIFLIPSELSPIQRIPSFYYPKPLKGAGTGQQTVAGEYLLSNHEAEFCWIAIAEPNDDAEFAFNVIYNELEHGGAAHNNAEDFSSGAVAGHSHPLFTDCRSDQFRGLLEAEQYEFSCGTVE